MEKQQQVTAFYAISTEEEMEDNPEAEKAR